MFKRMTIMILALVLILGGIFGFKFFVGMKMAEFFANRKMPPIAVEAAEVRAQNWQPTLAAVGTLEAINGVDIKAELSGVVKEIAFQSGQEVEEGALLVQLDDSLEQADRLNNQAQLTLARSDYKRDRNLRRQDTVSQAALDKSRAQLESAEAQLKHTQTLITKKQIRAPFAGRLGIRQFDLGEYVSVGQTLVTLQLLDSLHVNFTLPEQAIPTLAVGQRVRLQVEAYPDEAFSGTVNAIDAKVDEKTRTIRVQAEVPNADRRLFPGMFADVQVLLPEVRDVVRVPVTAISYSLYGDSVFVVKTTSDNPGKSVVERRYVKTGAAREDWVTIVEGLSPGERIVTAGQLKLEDGSEVIAAAATERAGKQ